MSGRRNIRFIGYHGGVEGLLSRSDVYFQPSVLENHSLSIIGAMNCSLPCVVSGAGGNPESVLDGVTGFVLQHEEGKGMAEKLAGLAVRRRPQAENGESGAGTLREALLREGVERKIHGAERGGAQPLTGGVRAALEDCRRDR